MEMKKLLNIVSESKINECGMPMENPATMAPPVPPVSMSVNLNAQGIDQIKDLLGLMNKVDAPLAPGPVAPAAMPPMPMPTVAPEMPISIKAIGGDEPGPEMGKDPLDDLIKKAGVAVKKPEAKPEAEKEEEADLSQMADEVRDMADTLANTPAEKIAGMDAAVPSGDDLHKNKKMYPKAQDGDNPMAVETQLKSTLMKLYKEMKESKKSKPDFLDVDKDGNKSEPMKKALKDKDVKEAEDRKPAKEKEREVTLPSGAKVKSRTVQGWQSQRADKDADKERKDNDKK